MPNTCALSPFASSATGTASWCSISTIPAPVLLGVLENIFIYNGQPGHEIVFVYDAQFVDQELYEEERFTVHEDTGETFHAVWLELSASGPHTPPV